MWEETLVFTVHMPEIALVRFLVWDHDPIGRDFIGQRTLAFSSMMPGRGEARACRALRKARVGRVGGGDFDDWGPSCSRISPCVPRRDGRSLYLRTCGCQ